MKNDLLKTLSLLKANWNQPNKKDYLDIFLPILIECIHINDKEVVNATTIQSLLLKHHGINLPENVIKTLLNRAKTRKIIVADNKILKKNEKKIKIFRKKSNFENIKNEIINKYEKLITRLNVYAIENFKVKWSDRSNVEEELLSFLNKQGLLILSSLTSGVPLAQSFPIHKKSKFEYVIASFILYIEQHENELFNYFESIVQGNMLASSVYLPDIGRIKQKLDKTSFYFDTTFIIYALGYAGDPRKNACNELLDLLFKNNAKLYCFEHTIDEIEGIFSACAYSLSNKKYSDNFTYSAEYFLANNYSEDDLLLIKNKLRTEIENQLKFGIAQKPDYDDYSIDENSFDEYLRSQKYAKNESARRRDVDSISAILRLRHGITTEHIEESRAVFVTTNTKLARLSRNYFIENKLGEYKIPPCVTDHRLTTQVWLKMPNMAPSLSRKRIIADSYASIQPSGKFWSKYIEELNKLKGFGDITEKDYFLLRYDLTIRKNLMEISLGDPTHFDNEEFFINATIPELLKIAEENFRKEIEEKVVKEKKDLKSTIVDLEQNNIKLTSQLKKIKDDKLKINEENKEKYRCLADCWSKRLIFLLLTFLIVFIIIGNFLSFPFASKLIVVNSSQPLWITIAVISTIIFSVFSLINICTGKTVISVVNWFESFISQKIFNYLSNY